MTVPPGISIDFNTSDHVFTDPPSWTRIDNYPGIDITNVQVTRGRPDERSKTSPGSVTITGMDESGLLDPTNSSSPFYSGLVPVQQAAVSLWNPFTNLWSYIFRGYVASYALSFSSDLSKPFIDFTITLVDTLDLLNDAEVIPDSAGNMVPDENIGDSFYTGQHCDDRIRAVLADSATIMYGESGGNAPWPESMLQVASGNVYVQGYAYPNQSSLLQVIDDACDAEGPYSTNRFITKTGAFAFRGRYNRYAVDFYLADSDADRRPNHENVKWAVADEQSWTSGQGMAGINGFSWTIDKTNLINSCLITPNTIRTDAIPAQEVHDPTSIGKYGPRTSGNSLENLLIIKGEEEPPNNYIQEAHSYAQAMVDNYKNPVTRVSQLVITNPATESEFLNVHVTEQQQNTWEMLCGVELSDPVTIHTTHPGGGGFNGVDHFIEQIIYDIQPLSGPIWQVVMTLDLTPRAYYATMPASWDPPVAGAIMADFTYTQSGGLGSPIAVFTDTSTPGPSGPITAWAWDFGDGSTSTLQNPTHTYASVGLWSATLVVTGTGSDGTSKTSQGVILV